MDGVTGGAIAMIILIILRIIWDFCSMCNHPQRANIQDPSNIEMQDMSGKGRPTSAQQNAPMDVPAQPEATNNTYRPDSFDWTKLMQMHNVTPLPAVSVPSSRGARSGNANAKGKGKGKGKGNETLVAPPPRVFDWTGTNAISDEDLLCNAGEGSSRGVPRSSRFVFSNGERETTEVTLPIAINGQLTRNTSKSSRFVPVAA
ncbi:hypothetical protein PspLS_09580 [Pyricularia sp. CBS 133598]|nr:hypothetical protein PspLS_09580 [Pyricularia sp. CBS 133598]